MSWCVALGRHLDPCEWVSLGESGLVHSCPAGLDGPVIALMERVSSGMVLRLTRIFLKLWYRLVQLFAQLTAFLCDSDDFHRVFTLQPTGCCGSGGNTQLQRSPLSVFSVSFYSPCYDRANPGLGAVTVHIYWGNTRTRSVGCLWSTSGVYVYGQQMIH